MEKFLGKNGLIIFGKSNNYYNQNTLNFEELQNNFNSLNTRSNLNENDKNFLFAIYYFIFNNKEDYPGIIKKCILTNGQKSEARLISLFNYFEFEEKYKKSNKKDLYDYLNCLLGFQTVSKNSINEVLFHYYAALANFLNGDLKTAENFQMETVILLLDGGFQKNFKDFVEIKNKILSFKIGKSIYDINHPELLTICKDLYSSALSNNKLLEIAIKAGLYLFNFYIAKYNTSECLKLLNTMDYQLSNNSYNKINLISLETKASLLTSIYSKKAYCYLLDSNSLELYKLICLMNNFRNVSGKQRQLIEYLILLYELNLDINKVPMNQVQVNINNYNYFLSPANINYKVFDSFIEFYINLNIICGDNLQERQVIEQYLQNNLVQFKEGKLSSKDLIIYFFIVYNEISKNVRLLKTEKNKLKIEAYIKKLSDNGKILFDFLRINLDKNAIFKLKVIQEMMIHVIFVCANVLFIQEDKKGAIEYLNIFDYFMNKIPKNESKLLSSCGYIFKLRGDISFYEERYDKALEHYLTSNSYFRNGNDKEMALNYFNIGTCYLLLKNYELGEEILNQSKVYYTNLSKKTNNCNISSIGGVGSQFYNNKVALISKLLKSIPKH